MEKNMITISAEDSLIGPSISIFLDGKDVSEDCHRACVPCNRGWEAWGWVDLLVTEEFEHVYSDGRKGTIKVCRMDSDGNYVVNRIHGMVLWNSDVI